MTFQPDITEPNEKQLTEFLVSQAAKLDISAKDLLSLAKHGHVTKHDEVYGYSWWINGKRVLGWNSTELHFDVPSLKEG